jgi:two-component system, OmpR family, sensor histidine kinase VicK
MLNRELRGDDRDARQSRRGATHPTQRRASPGTSSSHDEDRTLRQITSVIEGLPEPIVLTDDADRVVLTNPSADALFAGQPVRDRADLLSRFETAIAARPDADDTSGASASDPTRTMRPTGESVTVRLRQAPNRWFSIETFRLRRPDPGSGLGQRDAGGRVHVLRDVTDSQDLQPEREAFLSIMSHELRTPITTIYAGSSVLAHNAALSRPAAHSLALDISAEAARLYDLVEDLIVIARLERRVLEPLDEPVLLQRVADVTARVVASRAPDVSFMREGAADPPPVRGDGTYIEQTARDLAVAAARFGGEDGIIILRVDEKEAADEVVFRVLVHGAALTAVERAGMFDLGSGPPVGRLGGSGVGPFVARQLVQAMRGRTWAKNRPEGGIEIAFALPADRR